jgi:hypothetical protein
MLNRYVTLGLGLLVSVAVANWASAAEETDTRQPKPCGGYYACIELQPPQPGPVFRHRKSSLTDSGNALP